MIMSRNIGNKYGWLQQIRFDVGSLLCILVSIFSCFSISILTTSCDRYEIESYYTGTATVHLDIDWESRFGERPTGMTLMLAKDGDSITFTDISNDVDRYELHLEPGTYKMLIFNLTPGEFSTMRFYKMKSFDEAYAYADQLQRTTDFWDVNVSYIQEPEPIGCAVDTFTILPHMVDDVFHFVPWHEKVTNNKEELSLREVVEPMTTDLFIRVRILGISYMASVIGNISGLADGFLLSQAWRRDQASYHLLNNWAISRTRADGDSVSSNVGYITTHVNTFGLPHGRELLSQRDSTSNMLSLCFTLIDDRKILFRYPVGKYIRYRTIEADAIFTKQDITLELELIVDAPFYDDTNIPSLPYSQPTGTGAFDAEVADWGDEEKIDVPM